MPHILLIEDYRDTREVTTLILNDAGYTVTTASDGLRGVQLAVQCLPDLVLMDLALPRMNGWDAIECLKATPATHHIPVVAFTALVLPEDISRACAAGCCAVITKPFDIDALLTDIASMLASSTERDCSHGSLPCDA